MMKTLSLNSLATEILRRGAAKRSLSRKDLSGVQKKNGIFQRG